MVDFKDINIEEQDVFIPIGNCRPTEWLNEYSLRFHSLPFDWIHNVSLYTVPKIIEDDFNNFLTNVEELFYKQISEMNIKNRFVKDLTFNFFAMHHFSKSKPIEEQIKSVHKKYKTRGKWFNFLIKNADKVCFFTNYEFYEDAFTNFIDYMKKKYPKTKFTVINCHHVKDLGALETEVYNLSDVRVINLKFNDISSDLSSKLPHFGNAEIYCKIMPKLKLSKRYLCIRILLKIKSKLKSLIKLFSGKCL